MPSSYTTSLRLTLPATGELTGTWGTTVNTGITELLDAAVAGTTTISSWGGAGVPYTLSNTDGAADESRRMFIVASGTPGEAKNVICPAVSKLYFFRNDTIGGFALTLKTSGGSGITVPAGQARVLYCNGTNVVEAFNAISSLTLGTALGAGSGGTGQSTYVIGDLLYATGTTALSKLGIGTNGQILTSTGTAPQWSTLSGVAVTTFSGGTTGLTPTPATSGAVTLAGTLATTNGGTGLTSFTANRVFYASSTSAIGQSANLTFDGTSLTVGGKATLVADSPFLTGANLTSGANALAIGGQTGNSVVGFFVNNAEQMRLTTTGLGIGTSSPAAKLHLFDSAAPEARLQIGTTTSQGAFTFYSGSTKEGGIGLTPNSAILDISAGRSVAWGGKIAFTIDTAEQMRLTTTGLGIGTSLPQSRLQVEGAGVVANIIASSGNGNIRLADSPTSATRKEFTAILDTTNNRVELQAVQQGVGFLPLTLNPGGGNVGIGTTSPTVRLDVEQSSNSVLNILRIRNTNAGTSAQTVMLFGNDSSSGAASISMYANVHSTSPNEFSILNRIIDASSKITFGTQNTERARIDGSGNLLVGTTTNTNSSRLTVNGTISETVSSVQYLVASQFDVGTAPNKIPLNQYLGNLAYQNASAIAGRVGLSAGTAALPSIGSATDAATGEWFPATSVMAWSTGGVERMRLDAAGVLGLGVTPSAWTSTFRANQVSLASLAYDTANGVMELSNNVFASAAGVRSYITSNGATRYLQTIAGGHQWSTAVSGTAGNTISFTQAMTLTAAGGLVVGLTTDPGVGVISALNGFRINSNSYTRVADTDGSGGFGGGYNFALSGTGTPKHDSSGTTNGIYYRNGGALSFYAGPSAAAGTNAPERMSITTAGNVVIGTAAIATTATDGFLYIPVCAGAPTGVPTSQSGRSPLVVDSTNNRFYVYVNGSWKYAALV